MTPVPEPEMLPVNSVCAEDQLIGKALGHSPRLAIGVHLRYLMGGQVLRLNFFSLGRHDSELEAEIAQQFGTTR